MSSVNRRVHFISMLRTFFIILAVAFYCIAAAGPSFSAQKMPVIGYVKDAKGAAIQGASVMLVNEGGENSGPSDICYTNAEGLFHFINKTEGVYSVNVSADNYHSYQDTFHLDFNTRQVIDIVLTRGDLFEAETIYIGKNTGNISGTVVAEDDESPLCDAVVSIEGAFVQTNDAGRFTMKNVGTGEKKITIQKTGFEKIEKEILITPSDQNAVIKLVRIVKFGTVLGRVRVKDYKELECPPIKVYLGGKTAVTDYRGNFKFENLRSGNYPIILIYNKKQIYENVVKVGRGLMSYEILIDKL